MRNPTFISAIATNIAARNRRHFRESGCSRPCHREQGQSATVLSGVQSGDSTSPGTGTFPITRLEAALAEALSRHAHDNRRLLSAIGAALLEAQQARQANAVVLDIIYAERRRKRRRQGDE